MRERLKDWKRRFGGLLGKKVIELTGDYTPDIRSLQTADIILVSFFFFEFSIHSLFLDNT